MNTRFTFFPGFALIIAKNNVTVIYIARKTEFAASFAAIENIGTKLFKKLY
jgi:hypothetical protein